MAKRSPEDYVAMSDAVENGEYTVKPEQQMARLDTFARLKAAIETALGQYRHSDLTDGQLAAQIFLAIFKENIAFYLDPQED